MRSESSVCSIGSHIQDAFVKDYVTGCRSRGEEPNWKYLAGCFSIMLFLLILSDALRRDEQQCLGRWRNILDPSLRKGPWTAQEDQMIRDLVALMGPKQWAAVAERLQGRTGKQCRERFVVLISQFLTCSAGTTTSTPPSINPHGHQTKNGLIFFSIDFHFKNYH
jgi:hypothetical protein